MRICFFSVIIHIFLHVCQSMSVSTLTVWTRVGVDGWKMENPLVICERGTIWLESYIYLFDITAIKQQALTVYHIAVFPFSTLVDSRFIALHYPPLPHQSAYQISLAY